MTAAPYLLHRHKLRAGRVGGLRRHIQGLKRDETTEANPTMVDEAGEPLGVKLLAPSMSATEQEALMDERKAILKHQAGAAPAPYVELLFVGARRVGETSWTFKEAEDWAEDVHEWINSRYPDSPVLDIALHGDESQFHVHALIAPRGRTADGELRLGMTAASMAADALITGRPVSGRWSTREEKSEAATRLQDDVWLHVGEVHGLLRGKRTSGRKHKELIKEKRAERILNEAAERADAIVSKALAKANELTDGAKIKDIEAERNLAEAAKLLESQRGLLARRRIAKVERREAKADERDAEQDARDRLLDERKAELHRFANAIRREAKAMLAKADERASAWWSARERELEAIESEPETHTSDPVIPEPERSTIERKRDGRGRI